MLACLRHTFNQSKNYYNQHLYVQRLLQYLVYEIFWIHLLSVWKHSGSLFTIVEHSCSDGRVGPFSACVYISSCWHDRSDRCYFCIFKNQFVVYNFFYFFCANQFFKSCVFKLVTKCQCSSRQQWQNSSVMALKTVEFCSALKVSSVWLTL